MGLIRIRCALAALAILLATQVGSGCSACVMTNTHFRYTGNGYSNGEAVFSAYVDWDIMPPSGGSFVSDGCTTTVTGGENVACGGGTPPQGSNLETVASWNSQQKSGTHNNFSVTTKIICYTPCPGCPKPNRMYESSGVAASYLCN
jgi:hypothetical protein